MVLPATMPVAEATLIVVVLELVTAVASEVVVMAVCATPGIENSASTSPIRRDFQFFMSLCPFQIELVLRSGDCNSAVVLVEVAEPNAHVKAVRHLRFPLIPCPNKASAHSGIGVSGDFTLLNCFGNFKLPASKSKGILGQQERNNSRQSAWGRGTGPESQCRRVRRQRINVLVLRTRAEDGRQD